MARRQPPSGLPVISGMLTNPDLLLLTGTYAAVGYYEYTLFYWMKYYFSDVLHYPEQTSRYFTSVVSMSMVVAMPLGGILSDWLVRAWGYRAGRSAVPIFGMFASAVLLFVATSVQVRCSWSRCSFWHMPRSASARPPPGLPAWRSVAKAAAPPLRS